MTSISKNMYIDKLNDIVIEYNNTHHRTIKMKPVDVENNAYINSSKDVNDKNPKFQVGDHVKISKYKNIFTKGYTPNWSEEIFVIKEVRSTEIVDGNKMISVALNNYKHVCGSCTIYIVCFVIFFIVSISVSSFFIYFCWCLKKDNTNIININPSTETVFY